MQEAKGESNAERLETVAAIAEQQLRWINANASEYEHSTASADSRHTTSIYELLEQRAQTAARRLSVKAPGLDLSGVCCSRSSRRDASAPTAPEQGALPPAAAAASPTRPEARDDPGSHGSSPLRNGSVVAAAEVEH